MSFVKDRVEGVSHYARKTFFGILCLLFALLACVCFALGIWEVIQIFFVTTWMTIKAAGLVFAGAICVLLTMAMAALGSGDKRGRRGSKPNVEVLPPENVHPIRAVDGTIEVYEKGTRV